MDTLVVEKGQKKRSFIPSEAKRKTDRKVMGEMIEKGIIIKKRKQQNTANEHISSRKATLRDSSREKKEKRKMNVTRLIGRIKVVTLIIIFFFDVVVSLITYVNAKKK